MLFIAGILSWIFLRTGDVPPAPPPTPVDLDMPTVMTGELQFREEMKQAEIENQREIALRSTELDKSREIVKSGDIKLCDSISLEDIRVECVWRITLIEASNSGDIKLCDSLSETLLSECRDASYMSLALGVAQTGSLEDRKWVCAKIDNREKKAGCLSGIEREIVSSMGSLTGSLSGKDCDKLSSTWAQIACAEVVEEKSDFTRFSEVTSRGDIVGCRDIKDESLRRKCSDGIIYKSARTNWDISLCNSLSNPSLGLQCTREVRNINDQSSLRTALDKSDPNLCDTIKDESLRTSCSAQIRLKLAIATRDASSCNGVSSDMQDTCRQTIEILNSK
jgi:hypothetical protein